MPLSEEELSLADDFQPQQEPEAPGETIGDEYQEKQLGKAQDAVVLKDWYREALVGRAREGSYDPVLVALDAAKKKQTNNVYELSYGGRQRLLAEASGEVQNQISYGAMHTYMIKEDPYKSSWVNTTEVPSVSTNNVDFTDEESVSEFAEKLEDGWDYRTAELGRNGEELPPRAKGWKPNGEPYYGANFFSFWPKALDQGDKSQAMNFGFKSEEERTDWEKFWDVRYGENSFSKTWARNLGTIVGDAGLWIVREAVQRPLGTALLTAEDIGERSRLPEMPTFARNFVETGFGEGASDWLFSFTERAGRARNFYNVYRVADTVISGRMTFDEVSESLHDNYLASRMAYSIGAGDNMTQAEFKQRVLDGENPDLVAYDMEKPMSQFAGYFVYDPFNIVDILGKSAVQSTRIASHADEVAALIPELAQQMGKNVDEIDDAWRMLKPALKGDETADVATQLSKADEIIAGWKSGLTRIGAGIEKVASEFGIAKRWGSARRSKAFGRAGLFAGALTEMARTPDEALDIAVNLVRLGSDNQDEARHALAMLNDMTDAPNVLFSEGAAEFSIYMRALLDDGAGGINPKIILEGIEGFIETGDVNGLIRHATSKLDKIINETYPTLQELIDAEKLLKKGEEISPGAQRFFDNGGKISLIDRVINRGINKGFFGKLQREVAGINYIGLNPKVATRGVVFDTILAGVDMGADIYRNSPQKWGEVSDMWLGFEHAGMMQGFSKADIASFDDYANTHSSYKDMGSLLDAIINKGATADDVGLAKTAYETLKNPSGRAMQWFEQKSSQRIIGKAVDDAMRHLTRRVLPDIDDMVKAGMPEEIARSMTERIINNYGDVDLTKADVLADLSEGSIDALKQMDWLPEETEKILAKWGIHDDLRKTVVAGSGGPLDELLTEVKKIRDGLLSRSDETLNQHALPSVDPDNPEIDIGTALQGFYKGLEEGAVKGDDVADISNKVQANRNVIASMHEAVEQFQLRINKLIRFEGEKVGKSLNTVNQEIEQVAKIFRGLPDFLDDWARQTGKSSDETTKAWEFTERLLEGTEDLAELKQKIWSFFGFSSDVPKTRIQVKDKMWSSFKSTKVSEFAAARDKSVGLFSAVLGDLQKILPESVYNEIIQSGSTRAVFENLAVAQAMDESIMVGGQMKPAGQVIRSLVGVGDTENAARGISALLDPYIGSLEIGSRVHDNDILRIYNRYNDEAVNALGDVDLNKLFDAFTQWRADPVTGDYPKIANTLDDLIGYKPFNPIPDGDDAIYSLIQKAQRENRIRPKDSEKLLGWIRKNTDGTKLNEILDGGDPKQMMQELIEHADDVMRSKIDDAGLNPLDTLDDAAEVKIYQGRTGGKVGRSWTRSPEYAANYGDEVYETTVSGAEWKEAVKRTAGDPGTEVVTGEGAIKAGLEEGRFPSGFGDDASTYKPPSPNLDDIPSVPPPHDGSAPSTGRDVLQSEDQIWAIFENIIAEIKKKHGQKTYVGVDDELLGATSRWFDKASSRMSEARATAAKFAQGMRDFILHDYTDKYGIDALLSMGTNFHFWPTRTAVKFAKRAPYNMGVVNKYAQFRNLMEKIHADSPEWYRYSLNSNEILGLDMDNPLIFNLENAFIPFNNLTGGFDDPDKRVNWWTSILDGVSQGNFGHPNMYFQYATAIALKAIGEDRAAALWGGRLTPATNLIKGATSLAGVRGGKGVELDPAIRGFSEQGFFGENVLGPYEENRVVKILAQMGIDNPEIAEQSMDTALNREGPLWEMAIKMSRRKDAVGSIASTFIGIGARVRSKDDLVVDQFWSDYIRLMSTSENMPPDEFRENYRLLGEKYPFMNTMLLGRKGGLERDRAYAYAVMSRIPPGTSSEVYKALGLDQDIVSQFYDSKGDLSQMPKTDREKFMASIAEIGATLAIPEDPVEAEWNESRTRYGDMREKGKQLFGENIWDKLDFAYAYKGTGVNEDEEWYNYLDEHPEVTDAMDWQSQYILMDEVLASYYGSLDKLRSYYKGQMYNTLEKEFGEDIFDINTKYYAYKDTGQKEKAKQYKAAHPELQEYYDRKSEISDDIEARMVAFGEKLSDGEGMRIREDAKLEAQGEKALAQVRNELQTKNYTRAEWAQLIDPIKGPIITQLVIEIYEGIFDPPADIRDYFEEIADGFGLSYPELLRSIGEAE